MKLQPALSHMVEIDDTFVIGPQHAYEQYNRNVINKGLDDGRGYLVIHACKEPAHRDRVGYTTPSAPKGKDYFFVMDEDKERNRTDLYLNLIDGRSISYMPNEIFTKALQAIYQAINNGNGKKVVVYCNKGESRSAGIVLLFFIMSNRDSVMDKFGDLDEIIEYFKKNYYPYINLGKGMYEVIEDAYNNKRAIRR